MAVENPVKFDNPHGETDSAVVFVHGFTGAGVETWGNFPDILRSHPELGRFDFFFWQYPTELHLKYAVTKWFWEANPGIETLGDRLRALLEDTIGSAQDYEEIKLVAHSMGGLVVQTYVVEELRRLREGITAPDDTLLHRINEIVLFATPSGGLRKARFGGFLNQQITDMSDVGPFVSNLRAEWRELVDDARHDPETSAAFRLTAVAGMKDRFVPPESALDPFPLDDHSMSPGNHAELVKPEKVGQQPVDLLVRRITRPTPTGEELAVVHGRTAHAVDMVRLVEAAADVGDRDTLLETAADLLASDPSLPTVERTLGLALGRQAEHGVAAELLRRCLDFTLEDGTRPFVDDAQVIQQLAIAESGQGDHTRAIATLKSLPEKAQLDPESLGITAGRIKRRWLESGPPRQRPLARQARDTYRTGFEAAKDAGDNDEVLYNGINTAFMSLALGEDPAALAEEVLAATAAGGDAYWVAATRAEALFLLERYEEAEAAYREAFDLTLDARYLATTGLQARTIAELRGNPPEAAGILDLFGDQLGQPEDMAAIHEELEQAKDEEEAPISAER